jgi:hypothetical protein
MLFGHIGCGILSWASRKTMIFVLVALAAFAAGFINAVAGGGSFLTFPALIAAGLPPIDANASSTVALFPGQIATGYAARDGLAAASADSRVNVPVLATISLAGGLIGGLLLRRSRPLAMDDRRRDWRDCRGLRRIARGAAGAGTNSQKLRRRGGPCADRLLLHETGVTGLRFLFLEQAKRKIPC